MCVYIYIYVYVYEYIYVYIHMYIVGLIKLQVSFAEYCLIYRALLQKRPIILSMLLTKATSYRYTRDQTTAHCNTLQHTATHCNTHAGVLYIVTTDDMYVCAQANIHICMYVYVYIYTHYVYTYTHMQAHTL